jgi:carbamoyl-phosphate synthase large subunit
VERPRSTTSPRSTRVPPTRRTTPRPREDEPIRWIDEPGRHASRSRHAQRIGGARRPARLPRAVGQPPLARPRPPPPRRPGADRPRGDRDLAVVPGRDGAQRRAGGRGRRDRPSPRRRDDAEAATLLATVKRAGFGDRELAGWPGRTGGGDPERTARLGLRPGYAMVDTCAAEFAAETPYFYSTYAAAGSPPEAPPVRPAGSARHRQSGRSGSGRGSSSTTAPSRPRTTLRRRLEAVMVNSNPETVSTDFDASTRLYFEPLDPSPCGAVIDAETSSRAIGHAAPGRRRVRWPDPAQPRGPLVAGGVPLLGSDLEAIDQAEERTRFSALLDRLGIPQPEGGMAQSHRGGADARRADRLPGHRPPVVRDRRPRHRLRYSPRTSHASWPRPTVVDPRPPGPHRPLSSRGRGRHRRGLRWRGVLIPGLLEHVERAGVHSGDSVGSSRRRRSPRATRR